MTTDSQSPNCNANDNSNSPKQSLSEAGDAASAKASSTNHPEIDTAAVLRAALETGSESGIITGTRESMLQAMRETEFYEYLMISSDIEDLKRRTLTLVKQLGFTDFAFTLLDTIREPDGLLFSGPAELVKTYYHMALYKHDLLWKYLAICNGPIFQSVIFDYVETAPFQTETLQKNQTLAQLMASFGYTDAYVLPMTSLHGERCLLIVYGANMPRSVFQHKVEVCNGGLELLCCAIDYICSTRFSKAIEGSSKSVRVKLTPRLLELLKHLTVNDCNLRQAADKMNISVKTVNAHIAAVKKAFGVSTSTAAVFCAIKHELIAIE